MRTSGIYEIQSRIKPQRFYIGSAINIDRRWYEHLHDLKLNKHDNPKLQNHYNKYSKNDLMFIIVEECSSEMLIQREQHYINELKPYFNICKIAGNTLGIRYKLSKEACNNISKGHLGHIAWNKGLTKESDERLKMSEESKNNISKSKLGKKRKPFTEKTKAIMSKLRLGKPKSEEFKLKMIGNNYGVGNKGRISPMKGKHPTEETSRKHSETNIRIGLKPPSQKGKHPSKETIEKRKNTRAINKLKLIRFS